MKLHFILCLERTGSSMLASMLNSSDELISPSEEPFMLYFYRRYGNIINWKDKDLIALANDFFLLHDKNLKIYFNQREQLVANLLKLKRDSTYIEVCKEIYLNFYPRRDKSRVNTIIDKQIKYSYLPGKILRLCPESKFVVLVRNPLDNLASWKKRKLGSTQGATYLSEVWRDLYSILLQFSNAHQDRVLRIKYENLVKKPEATLMEVCEFLGIEYNPEMLSFNEKFGQFTTDATQRDPRFAEKLHDFHSGLHKKVNEENINIYSNFFTREETEVITTNCKNIAEQFGYQLPDFTPRKEAFSGLKKLKSRWTRRYILALYYHTPFWLKKVLRKIRPKKVDA